MARSSTRLAALIALTLLGLGAQPSFGEAPARPAPQTLTLAYDGVLLIKVLDMRLRQRLQPGAFAVSAQLKSYGVLSLFKKIDVQAASNGRLDGASAQPLVFQHANRDGEANRQVEVRWTGADVATRISVPYPTIGDPQPTREQKLAAADPLTQLTRLALISPGQRPCNEAMTFYDGRQLYRLDFQPPAPRDLSERERRLDLDSPIRCAFTFTEVAGFDPKPPQKKNQGLGQPLSMDLAQLGAEGRWVITAVRGRTPLGEARIQIREIARD